MRWSRWYRLVIAREVLCWKGCRSVGGEFFDEVTDRDGQTARASSKLEPKMASFHSSAPAPKKIPEPKKLGSGSKIENQSQKAWLWLQNKTNQSQKLGSGSRIFLWLDHQ